MSLPTLVVDPRFNGPDTSANGGYVAGRLAAWLPAAATAATVTLRQPPPLARELTVTGSPEGVHLLDGDQLLADAVPDGPESAPVDPVSYERARAAEQAFRGWEDHAFPHCFVCGTAREAGDGLRLFPGPVPGRTGVVATAWVPNPGLAGHDGERVAPEFVWAALDCPGAWTVMRPGERLLLGRLAVRVDELPVVGDHCVVMGALSRREGRKVFTATTLYDGDGRVAARADAVWIEPRST